MQKERRSKKRVESNSSRPPPPSKPKTPKRKAIIHESEEEEEEQEECPLKRQPKDIAQRQPLSVPSLADTMDQPDPSSLIQPAVAKLAAQSLPATATATTTASATQQCPTTPPIPLALIPDEELEEYFSAPITQPPSGLSSPIH